MGSRWFQDGYKRATMSEDRAKRFKGGDMDGKMAPRCEKRGMSRALAPPGGATAECEPPTGLRAQAPGRVREGL